MYRRLILHMLSEEGFWGGEYYFQKKIKNFDDVFPCRVFIAYKHDIYELRKIYKILHRGIYSG
jgi:hypothetical protein